VSECVSAAPRYNNNNNKDTEGGHNHIFIRQRICNRVVVEVPLEQRTARLPPTPSAEKYLRIVCIGIVVVAVFVCLFWCNTEAISYM
jgi:hypothetical protein